MRLHLRAYTNWERNLDPPEGREDEALENLGDRYPTVFITKDSSTLEQRTPAYYELWDQIFGTKEGLSTELCAKLKALDFDYETDKDGTVTSYHLEHDLTSEDCKTINAFIQARCKEIGIPCIASVDVIDLNALPGRFIDDLVEKELDSLD
jgi:hypothetical protein